MCPSVKFHRRAGNAFLRAFNGDYYIVKMVPKKLKEELCIIAKIAESARNGLPIAEERCPPPLTH